MKSVLIRDKFGFTLIEISLVLVVLSLLLSGVLAALTQASRRANQTELQRKMDAIETALINYRKYYNSLPYPADSTALPTSTCFGVPWPTPGTCTAGPTYTGSASQNNLSGDVPVRILNLPDDYMFDPWGGRFVYVVSQAMTAASAFVTYPVGAAGNPGDIAITDGSSITNPLATGGSPSNLRNTTGAIALLMSYGADGHGAYQISGNRKSSGSDNNAEWQNCHCNATLGATNTTASYVQQIATGVANDPVNIFDDVVRYYLRSDLLSSTDVSR